MKLWNVYRSQDHFVLKIKRKVCKECWIFELYIAILQLATLLIIILNIKIDSYPCVKSVRIRSIYGPYFPRFGLNAERCISLYSVWMRENTVQKNFEYGNLSRSGKIHTFSGIRKNFDHRMELVFQLKMVKLAEPYLISSPRPDIKILSRCASE